LRQSPTVTIPIKTSIFWSQDTDAHIVAGEILDEYLKLGGPLGKLGYPISDEMDTPDGQGRVSHFEEGYILWHGARGARTQFV
jgi:uncharacterized protein with LGFP repeats